MPKWIKIVLTSAAVSAVLSSIISAVIQHILAKRRINWETLLKRKSDFLVKNFERLTEIHQKFNELFSRYHQNLKDLEYKYQIPESIPEIIVTLENQKSQMMQIFRNAEPFLPEEKMKSLYSDASFIKEKVSKISSWIKADAVTEDRKNEISQFFFDFGDYSKKILDELTLELRHLSQEVRTINEN